ncbi:hypothetical protein CVU75_00945 [Candidatus Dependentiae bacterium HGW-Dependentiae-1]|nr:MAG: hypothetical protein CVU75_00945 [Candidatus Dependentiae bacterium HGW-Dependentiae-1]
MIKRALKKIVLAGIGFFFAVPPLCIQASTPMYFCMAADEEYFSRLVNLIGSIHRVNFDETVAIAVYDLGFTQAQRAELNRIAKVQVYDIEMTNSDLLTYFMARKRTAGEPQGRKARGWYMWKPVAIKQALDMFPYVLYIDAGITVNNKLDRLFEHVKQNGCFFVDTGSYSIRWMSTKFVVKTLQLESPARKFVLDDRLTGLSAGFQGISKALYQSYVLPIYEHTRDTRFFVDDGTSPTGFGDGRSDQTLFSIYARLLGLPIFQVLGGGRGELLIDGKKVPFHLGEFISFTRNNINLSYMKQCIHYK